jgi:hypothetical protein
LERYGGPEAAEGFEGGDLFRHVLYEGGAKGVDYGEEFGGREGRFGAFEGEKIGFVGFDAGLEFI